MNVPSKNDIDKINRKLNKILRAVEAQKPATRKAPAKKAATKKATTKKTPAAKPAGRSESKAA